MALIYRRDKKGPLTINEIDGNFETLDCRLTKLEIQGVRGEGIKEIQQIGDIIHVIGDQGTLFGKITLPRILPRFRGQWETGQTYLPFDWISTKGKGLYTCLHPHEATTWEEGIENKIWQEILPEGAVL